MKTIVLMYHDVYDLEPKESGFTSLGALHYKISKDVFEEHLKCISDYCHVKNICKEKIVFTFDDGGISFYSIIAPMLEKYGWIGHFFVSTNYIGTKGFLSENQIKELRVRGHVLGSHSHRHQVLTKMSLDDVKKEITRSKNKLSDILDEQVDTISIPNGSYSKEILKIAVENGFKKIYTSEPTTKIGRLADTLLVGRYAIIYSTTVGDLIRILSSPYLRLKMECNYQILHLVKQLLGSYYSKIKSIIREKLIK